MTVSPAAGSAQERDARPDASPRRLSSLDALRGMTVAAMIVVNSPGNRTAYAQLDHAQWHGCTAADLVFPFFLFIVGVSLAFSLSKRLEADGAEGMGPRIFRRALALFALGMLLNAIPGYHLSSIRVPGVLQRIAVCYLLAGLLFIKTSLRARLVFTAAALVGSWLLLTRIPVPGYGAGALSPEGNLASWLDRLALGAHIYRQGPYDPEGILSTLGALATTMAGTFAGQWLRSGAAQGAKIKGLLRAGAFTFTAGWLWSLSFPLNKALWTSSYALYTAGLALWGLALCYWLIEVRGIRAWARPFEGLGANAIAAYVLPILLIKFLVFYRLPVPGLQDVQPRIFICDHIFGTWLSPLNASAAFAFSYTFAWLVFFGLLYRRGVVIKI